MTEAKEVGFTVNQPPVALSNSHPAIFLPIIYIGMPYMNGATVINGKNS